MCPYGENQKKNRN
jgi:hypothetical protein